jgi:hypothetical protein
MRGSAKIATVPMTDRGASMQVKQPVRPYGALAQKWRDLAERRRAHFLELHKTGRWKHYYTEERFLAEMREAARAAETWARLAPSDDAPRKTK